MFEEEVSSCRVGELRFRNDEMGKLVVADNRESLVCRRGVDDEDFF